MVSDDLNRIRHLCGAVPVMEKEPFRSPEILQRQRIRQLPIVISRQDNRLARLRKSLDQSPYLGRRGAVMDEVADDDEVARLIVREELLKPVFNGSHPPYRQ